MRFNKLDLNQLVLLDALLSEKSVVRAANKVFLSPPAASNGLSRLREFFADELLVQIGRTMVLTPLSESLIEPVREVLFKIHAITTTRPIFEPALSNRRIKIEASDYVIEVLLARVLRELWKSAPNMQFELTSLCESSRERLDTGDIDILIVPDFFTANGHPSELLFEDTFTCLVWEGNACIEGEMTTEQYLSMGHVGVQWGLNKVHSIDEVILLQQGMKRRREIVAPSFVLLPYLLTGTNRVATVHSRLAKTIPDCYGLRLVDCPIKLPKLQEAVQWHKYQNNDPALKWLKEKIKEFSEQLGSIPGNLKLEVQHLTPR